MRICHQKLMLMLPPAIGVRLEFYRKFKRFPVLKNPMTFTDKIAWRKLYDKNPLFVEWNDKLRSKELAASLIGKEITMPNLYVGSPEDIPFYDIPKPYVLKTNFACGDSIFIRSDDDIDEEAIKKHFRTIFKRSYGLTTHEWHYNKMPKYVFAEPMMIRKNGKCPEDIKFHIFNGKIGFIVVDSDRFDGHKQNMFDEDWNDIPFDMKLPKNPEPPSKPECFEEMKRIACEIGKLFDYVRVDLYDYESKPVLGEVTFFSATGYMTFRPERYNIYFGQMWRLPKLKPTKASPIASSNLLSENTSASTNEAKLSLTRSIGSLNTTTDMR